MVAHTYDPVFGRWRHMHVSAKSAWAIQSKKKKVNQQINGLMNIEGPCVPQDELSHKKIISGRNWGPGNGCPRCNSRKAWETMASWRKL